MFSIVVSTYNRSRLLRRCLDSIRKQTFRNYEVLILDDCSTDDTQEVVKEYLKDERFKYVRMEKNLGFANRVVYEAQKKGLFNGEYVFEMCDDDYLCETFFLNSVYEAVSDKNVDVVLFDMGWHYFADFMIQNKNGELPKYSFKYQELTLSEKQLLFSKMSNIIKREWIEKYDFFNEEVQKCEDVYFEYSNELIYAYATMCYVSNITYIGGVSPSARTKYIDLYNWIVSMGMYFDGTKDIELSARQLSDIFSSPSTFQNVLIEWKGKALAESLSAFMGDDNYSIYLRKIAQIYRDKFQDKINERYSELNEKLLNEQETIEAFKYAKNIVVYSDGFISQSVKHYLRKKNKNILFVADDFKEGCFSYKDIIVRANEIDMVFIATTNIRHIKEMLEKIELLRERIFIVSLVLRDDMWGIV